MKKTNILFLALILILALALPASAGILDDIKALFSSTKEQVILVYVDGEPVSFPDQQPYIDSNSRTLVPVRFVSESLGAEVEWNPERQEVEVNHQAIGKTVLLWINKKDYTVNGVKATMDTQAIITAQSRTMVPLRFVSEALNAKVDWQPIGKNGVVHIFTKEQNAEEIKQIKDKAESDLTGKTPEQPKVSRYPVLDQYEKTGITKEEQLTPEVVEALKGLIGPLFSHQGVWEGDWTVPNDALYAEHEKAIKRDFANAKVFPNAKSLVISKDMVWLRESSAIINGEEFHSKTWYYIGIVDGEQFAEAKVYNNGGLRTSFTPRGDGLIFDLNHKEVK